MLERLQKVLAEGGIGSRRDCEILITEGRVEVDREIVTKLGTKVDPEKQLIRVDGEVVKISPRKYFAVNKPRGVLSTNFDQSGRMRVVDLIATDQHIYTVGRLDKDSEGLIIVTNDGDLANRLTHPKYGVEKTYMISVEGHPTREQMETLQAGVYIAEGLAHVKRFLFKKKLKSTTEIEIVLDEGRNREVRRLLARIGHKVLTLRRIGIGSFFLNDIPAAGNKQLSSEDVAQLFVNPKVKTKGGGKSKAAPKKKVAKKVSFHKFIKSAEENADPKPNHRSDKNRSTQTPGKRKTVAKKKFSGKKSVAKKKSAGRRGADKPVGGRRSGAKKGVNAKNKSDKKTGVKKPNRKTIARKKASGKPKKQK